MAKSTVRAMKITRVYLARLAAEKYKSIQGVSLDNVRLKF
jgi:hypothetical protein